MNKEIEKKEYVAPAMTIVDMESENAPILCCSDGNDFFCGEDDEIVDAP